MYVQVSNGQSNRLFIPQLEGGRSALEIYKHYDNLFKAFYNIIPDFDESSFGHLIQSCGSLLAVAEAHDAVTHIADKIDLALLRKHGQLFDAIAVNPAPWSELGLRLESPTIFREAIIHLVGRWPSMSEGVRSNLRDEIRLLCQKKHDALHARKGVIEVRIASYYPQVLDRTVEFNPGRHSYSSDIYLWMAVSLFRHWFAQAVCEDRGRNSIDGGARLYRQLDAAGYAYLDRRAQQRYHERFPMTPKGIQALATALSTIKEDVKALVAEVLINRALIDVEEKGTPYLTCCTVAKEDFPWAKSSPVDPDETEDELWDDSDLCSVHESRPGAGDKDLHRRDNDGDEQAKKDKEDDRRRDNADDDKPQKRAKREKQIQGQMDGEDSDAGRRRMQPGSSPALQYGQK